MFTRQFVSGPEDHLKLFQCLKQVFTRQFVSGPEDHFTIDDVDYAFITDIRKISKSTNTQSLGNCGGACVLVSGMGVFMGNCGGACVWNG